MIDYVRPREGKRQQKLAYSYREAAELLGVSQRTVFEWVKLGRLRAMKIGRTVRISLQAIEDFIIEVESNEGLDE